MSDVTKKVEEFLKQKGFKFGFYSCCLHTEGMPGGEGVFVKRNWSPVDGDYTLKVTPTSVYRLGITCPYNFSRWFVLEEIDYSSPEELVSILSALINQPKGCWA